MVTLTLANQSVTLTLFQDHMDVRKVKLPIIDSCLCLLSCYLRIMYSLIDLFLGSLIVTLSHHFIDLDQTSRSQWLLTAETQSSVYLISSISSRFCKQSSSNFHDCHLILTESSACYSACSLSEKFLNMGGCFEILYVLKMESLGKA